MGKSESSRKSRRILGKLRRRSPRLFGKPAVVSIRKRCKIEASGPVTYVSKGGLSAAQFMRSMRKARARLFRDKYIYEGSIGKRVYINSDGVSYSWTDRSTGCVWVAVHGTEGMSIAFMGTLDPARYPRLSINTVRRFYSLNVISEIEDIVLSKNPEWRLPLDMLVTKPFGIVSAIPSTHHSGALDYLKKRLEGRMEFTRNETLQITVMALQRLCNQEFKADDDIWVLRLVDDADSYLLPELLENLLADINTPSQTQELKQEQLAVNMP